MRAIFAMAVLACSVFLAQAADDDNPYKRSKVGDWIEYKMGGGGTSKVTITAKDDAEATYEVATTYVSGRQKTEAPVKTFKIDLSKPFDQNSAANLKGDNIVYEKFDEGTEKLILGEKEYQTMWKKVRANISGNGITIRLDLKMWFAKDVPLSGLVKMETTSSGSTTTLELTRTGGK